MTNIRLSCLGNEQYEGARISSLYFKESSKMPHMASDLKEALENIVMSL
jgi:hypothetical protein